ncbi:MAG: acylneuraminate cytidylyltransferase family protein [Alphaproteobacteria bacterium]|nr:acylneuraminate cytidylyltransferase family protein [Alphaproteobacteria bacterium]
MKIALIPARGGSKSIPLKNIKLFCGKPLIYWNLKALQDSIVDKIYVATDHPEIKKTVESFGFSKVEVYDRDPKNAQDKSSTESVLIEFIKNKNLAPEDFVFLVQLTSPMTRTSDFNNAWKKLTDGGYDSLLTAVEFKRFLWRTSPPFEPVNYKYKKRPLRQDFRGYYMENGAFYISSVAQILKFKNRISGKMVVYEMPTYMGVEIDEEVDWIIAEKLMETYNLK